MNKIGEILLVGATIMLLVTLCILTQTEKQLDDCRFEVNHLQTKLDRYEELNDLVPALYQILPPLALAELKVITLQIRNMKHEAYQGREIPMFYK